MEYEDRKIELLRNSDISSWRKSLNRDLLNRLRDPRQASRFLGVGQRPVHMNADIMAAYNQMYSEQPNCNFQIGEHWLPKPWGQQKFSSNEVFPKNIKVYKANIPVLTRAYSTDDDIPLKSVFVAPGTEEHENYSKLARQIWGVKPLGGTYLVGRPQHSGQDGKTRYTWITPDETKSPQWRFDVKNAINTRLYNHLSSKKKKVPKPDSVSWLKWRDRVMYEHPFALGFGTLPGVKEAHADLPNLEDYYEIIDDREAPKSTKQYHYEIPIKKPIENESLNDFAAMIM